MFEVKTGTWNPAGRSTSWRLSMLWAGLVVGAIGVAIIIWPEVIAYAIGGFMVLIGLGLVASALFARSATSKRRWDAEQGDVTVVVEAERPDEG